MIARVDCRWGRYIPKRRKRTPWQSCKGLANATSDNYVHKGFSKRRKKKLEEKDSAVYRKEPI